MINYLPTIYPDELVYSWFSRYFIHSGCFTNNMALSDLLQKRCHNPSKEFIGHLNQNAVKKIEEVISMDKVIERRGQLDIEKGQTAHISVPTLIKRCPTLYRQISSKPIKEQNRIVRTAINKGLELMKLHTDLYKCFVGLEFMLPDKISVKSEELINIKYVERVV